MLPLVASEASETPVPDDEEDFWKEITDERGKRGKQIDVWRKIKHLEEIRLQQAGVGRKKRDELRKKYHKSWF